VHVGLNLIYLVPGETGGMEVVARELLPELVRTAPGVRFTAFINREAAAAGGGPWGEVMPALTVPVHATSRPQWVAGDQALLPPMAARQGVDLLHSLASIAPAWGPFKRVVTVHDLIYARFPETHSGLRDLGMRVLVPLAVKRAHRVIVDAHSTRHDLIERLHTPPARIDVVPLGLGAPARHAPAPAAQVRERLGLAPDDDRRVLLSLSAKRPHKNLAALIRALALLTPERRAVLVLPGYPTEHEGELRRLAAERDVADYVRFQAWLSPEELEGLWGLADAFLFPSLYEGFGLPVLEAMDRGVPVACSNASSLPEVAGDAALLFDPHSDAAIAQALERVLQDAPLREQLIARGHLRAREFTWERTARGVLDSYARALGFAAVPSAWTAPSTLPSTSPPASTVPPASSPAPPA
jgi:glycosyltransferase involved in cell wall biosynthesis